MSLKVWGKGNKSNHQGKIEKGLDFHCYSYTHRRIYTKKFRCVEGFYSLLRTIHIINYAQPAHYFQLYRIQRRVFSAAAAYRRVVYLLQLALIPAVIISKALYTEYIKR